MATTTTITSDKAWSPDQHTFQPGAVIPDALILQHATIAGAIEGDEPLLRVAYVDDEEAAFVAEGTGIDESDPTLSEVTVATGKIAQLIRVSREQWHQLGTAAELSQSVRRAVVKKADAAFLSNAAPTAPALTPPAGILAITGIEDGGAVTENLDGLIDLVATLESNGGQPTGIILDPLAWASLRKFKTADGSAVSILGAGTSDAQRTLLDLPVTVSSAMTANSGVVLDRSAVIAAVGSVQVATNDAVYFASDSVGVRCTWRIGWNLVRPNRIGKFTVTTSTEG